MVRDLAEGLSADKRLLGGRGAMNESERSRRFTRVAGAGKDSGTDQCKMGNAAERLERHELNYAVNRGRIVESAEKVERVGVVWLVNDGPGLRKNRRLTGRIGTGAVVCIGRAWEAMEAERLDYLFCGEEFTAEAGDKRKLAGTTGVLEVGVAPGVHGLGMKREVWWTPMGGGEFEAKVREEQPGVMRLERGPSEACAALGWVARALAPRVIVLAGMDCAFTDSWRRYDEALRFEGEREYLVAEDIEGRAVMTDAEQLETAEWLTAAAWWLGRTGVRVINASEGGLLRHFVEVRGLAETIEELNEAR